MSATSVWDAHLPCQGREPVGGIIAIVCDAWPVRCQTYSYLPILHRYQIYTAWWQRHMMCVNSLPKAASKSTAAGSETRDLLIASPAPYHYATKPHHI